MSGLASKICFETCLFIMKQIAFEFAELYTDIRNEENE